LMMVVWPKHVAAITSKEEKKNCCVAGPIIALLTVQDVERSIVCTPLSVNVFVKTATYYCKALSETPCITGGSHIEP
jgi:hypothetical protein